MMSSAVWGGLFFCVLSLWFLKHSIQDLIKSMPSRKWPNVNGTILESEVICFSPTSERLELFVKYRYQVNGQEYTSNRVSLYTLSTKEVRDAGKRFTIKAEVPVFYNPNNASESLLITGKSKDKPYSDLIMSLIGLGVGIGITLGGYYGVLK